MVRDLEAIQRSFGARIQSLRADRRLTQEELARRCGISQKFLSEIERGEKTASFETLVAIAHDGFHVRIASMFSGVDDRISTDIRHADELLAGLSDDVRDRVLRAIDLLVRPALASDAPLAVRAAESQPPRLRRR